MNIKFDEKTRRVIDDSGGINWALLDNVQVKAVELVIENMRKQFDEEKRHNNPYVVIPAPIRDIDANDLRKSIDPRNSSAFYKKERNKLNRVYIAKYTMHDDYGALEEYQIFSKEEDALTFVVNKRENEGATDISVIPRSVN